MSVMRCGRRRWAIENETFQTLKARDAYRFEHNFGYGKNHLSDVFATLAMLAFLIDQVQQHCCPLFRKGARTPEAHPLSLEPDAGPGRDFRLPGLGDPLPRARGGAWQGGLCRPHPRRAVAAPATLDRPRSRPSPQLRNPGQPLGFSRARIDRQGLASARNGRRAGQQSGLSGIAANWPVSLDT